MEQYLHIFCPFINLYNLLTLYLCRLYLLYFSLFKSLTLSVALPYFATTPASNFATKAATPIVTLPPNDAR